MPIDRNAFYEGIRPLFGGRLKESQRSGLSAILDAWDAKMATSDLRWLAYMLATAFHETARQMQPVREAYWLSETWREAHLRYYPYYGRGYVQLTWPNNYEKAGAFVGANLVATPDLALRPDIAAVVMQVGMTEGWFRSDRHQRPHTLGRYFAHGIDDPVGAREIINGPEHPVIEGRRVLLASVIARYHAAFLGALSGQAADAPMAALADAVPAQDFGLPSSAAMEPAPALSDLADLAALISAIPGEAPSSVLPLTATIVAGYASGNAIAPADLPDLILAVHRTLLKIASGEPVGFDRGAAPHVAAPDDPAARDEGLLREAPQESPATSPRRRRQKPRSTE